MNSQGRLVELLTDWLEDQPSTAPDQLLESVFTDVQHTPQRARWMNLFRRFPMFAQNLPRAYVALGVALAAVIGFALWNGSFPTPPGQDASPTPAPIETAQPDPTDVATPNPTPEPTQAPMPDGSPRDIAGVLRQIEPGTYFRAGSFPVRVTFEVPGDGWVSGYMGSSETRIQTRTNTIWLAFAKMANVYADPCHWARGMLSPPIGPSVDDLADAIATFDAVEIEGPTETTLSGYHGKHVTLTDPESLDDCDVLRGHGRNEPVYMIGRTPEGVELWLEAGEVKSMWILDVEGTRLVILTEVMPDASEEELAHLQQILDSIQLEPREP